MRRHHILAGLAVAALSGCLAPPSGDQIGETRSALGYPNDKTAFDYFLGQGLGGVQAAAIVGNLDVESGVDPDAVQSGGPGRGIAQWSVGARWDHTTHDNVIWYAGTKGLSSKSLQLQLDFIWYELQTFSVYGLAKLEATTSITTATDDFSKYFEACGACNNSTRLSNAKRVLAAYGADVPPPSCVVTTTGVAGTCIAVTDCAAMDGYESTAGFCSGAGNIECCTPVLAPAVDGGSGASDDGGTTDVTGTSSTTDGGDVTKPGKGCDAAPGARSRTGTLFFVLAAMSLAVTRRRARSA